MNKHLKNYLSSFKLKKDFFYLFLTDIITFSLIFMLFSKLNNYIQYKSTQLMQGRTPEEIQQLLSSANPEQVLPFLLEVRSFLLLVFLIVILSVIVSFLLFSFSRAAIWNHLLKRRLTKKNYWRWNLLNISLLIPLAIFGFAYLIIKLIVTLIISLIFKLIPKFSIMYPQFVQTVQSIVNNVISFYLVLLMAVIIFLIYYQFTFKYKVWDSIGNGFKLLKEKLKPILKMVFLAMITAFVLTLLILPFKKFIIHLPILYGFVNLIVAALFFAWLRLYLLRTIHGTH